MIRPAAIVVAVLIAAAAIRAAEPRSGTLALGVMRRDGVLVPFAAFDGKRWTSTWPPPLLQLEIPINLQSVPKAWWGAAGLLADWQVWPAGRTSPPRAARVTQPDWVPAHCGRQIALKTDYRSDQPVPAITEQPYPKEGLAIAPAQPLERIEVIPPGGSAAEELASGLRVKFNEAEMEVHQRFGHPIPRKVREPMPPVIEALYAFGDNPRSFYVEATRTYRTEVKDCRIAFATGWFMRTGPGSGDIKWVDLVVDLLPCNKYGATYMLPFGALRAGARTFWIAQYAGWDYERYVVIELKKNAVEAVVSKWGGGC